MTLKLFILNQVREMKREMLVAIEGLSEDDLTSHEPGDHSPIAWIVEHCCANVDLFLHRGLTGQFRLEHDARFLSWPLIEPKPGDPYPPLDELAHRWTTLIDATVAALDRIPEEVLEEPREGEPPEPLVESCLRVINHQNAHLRQIWTIIGRRRIDHKWPVQGPWLA